MNNVDVAMWRQMYNINIILWYPVGCVSFSFIEQICFQCPAFSSSIRHQMTRTLFRLWFKSSKSLYILNYLIELSAASPAWSVLVTQAHVYCLSDFLRLLPAEFCTLVQITNKSHVKYFVTQPICGKPHYNHSFLNDDQYFSIHYPCTAQSNWYGP